MPAPKGNKNARGNKGGQPTKYKPEYAQHAEKLCLLHGATDDELAAFFGVHVGTIYRWSLAHVEFCEALKSGKDVADNRVERSLYHRAVGYTFDTEKVFASGVRIGQGACSP